MMGKDCERILSGIVGIKNSLEDALDLYASMVQSPIETEEYDIHHEDGSVETIKLKEDKISMMARVSSRISSASSSMSDDFSKMKTLNKKLYTSTTSFNNSNGSPWTEIDRLHKFMNKIESLTGKSIEYTSQVLVILSYISAGIALAVDAKNAISLYHDYVQRGYDANFNGRDPSITFTAGYARKTVGNINQDYTENVNIRPKSLDPF